VADLVRVFTEPLHYAFIVRAILASVIVGVACSTVGTFIVLRGMAFFGDALAHAILPGVAVGYLLGGGAQGPLFWGGLAAAVLAAVGIGTIARSAELKEDTAIGVVFAGAFALGIAMISSRSGYAVDLAHILFGDVLGVSGVDLLLTSGLAAVVVLTIVLLQKELVLMTFDPVLAETLRLPTAALYYLMLVLVAVTIVVSLQTVGVALMVAMLVTPAATAYMLTRRLSVMMALAAGIGAMSGAVGLFVSYYMEVASGAAIVLVSTAFFALAWTLAPERGWLARRRATSTATSGASPERGTPAAS
jgi:ABC-type Mn2+/Zn2+ transport system permease subunit